jgi:hypothetical protein
MHGPRRTPARVAAPLARHDRALRGPRRRQPRLCRAWPASAQENAYSPTHSAPISGGCSVGGTKGEIMQSQNHRATLTVLYESMLLCCVGSMIAFPIGAAFALQMSLSENLGVNLLAGSCQGMIGSLLVFSVARHETATTRYKLVCVGALISAFAAMFASYFTWLFLLSCTDL